MGKRGFPPAPTKLRVLRGETRPSRLNLREPQVGETPPRMPPTLSRAARPVWNYYVSRLRAAKVLSEVDRDSLAAYCEHVVNHRQMTELVRSSSFMSRSGRNATDLVKNPLVAMMRNEAGLIRAWSQEFGLTPSSRSQITTPLEQPSALESLLS